MKEHVFGKFCNRSFVIIANDKNTEKKTFSSFLIERRLINLRRIAWKYSFRNSFFNDNTCLGKWVILELVSFFETDIWGHKNVISLLLGILLNEFLIYNLYYFLIYFNAIYALENECCRLVYMHACVYYFKKETFSRW